MLQLQSELRKIMSTKTWLFLGLGAIAFSTLQTVAIFFISKQTSASQSGVIGLLDPAGVRNIYATAGSSQGYMFALILGIVAITSEFRFGTIVPTFLTTPQRQRPVLAKLAALGIVSGAMSLAVVVVTYTTGTILLATTSHAAVPLADIIYIALGAMLAYVLMGIVGVALGALLRNQILGVVLAVLWVFLLEGIINLLLTVLWHLNYIAKWLPGSAVASVVSSTSTRNTDYLPAWGGALVLLAYAVIFTGLAFSTTLRRDVN